jgi:uncharacterized BrkB/YihY/UPF0761 family membrane protein
MEHMVESDRSSAPADPTAEEIARPQGRVARARDRYAGARKRIEEANQRLQDTRTHLMPVDVVLSVQEDDRNAGGSLLGGAIAYRFFLWLLPAALVVVAGLGFDAAANPDAANQTVRALGITSIAAQSIDQAAKASQSARWFALIFGGVFLYLASVSLLKALFVAHALVWESPVPKIEHKPRLVGELMVAALILVGISALAAVVRNHSSGFGLLAMLGCVVFYGGAWWLFSVRLPHDGASVLELLPGAILFGVGAQVLHLIGVYYLAARFTHASLLYGVLGGSAALLFGLYLIGRLIIGAAVVNATIFERRHPDGGTGRAAVALSSLDPLSAGLPGGGDPPGDGAVLPAAGAPGAGDA